MKEIILLMEHGTTEEPYLEFWWFYRYENGIFHGKESMLSLGHLLSVE
jgi:hypothetical protein